MDGECDTISTASSVGASASQDEIHTNGDDKDVHVPEGLPEEPVTGDEHPTPADDDFGFTEQLPRVRWAKKKKKPLFAEPVPEVEAEAEAEPKPERKNSLSDWGGWGMASN